MNEGFYSVYSGVGDPVDCPFERQVYSGPVRIWIVYSWGKQLNVFAKKLTRTHLTVIAVAVMLVLAGCAEHSSPSTDSNEATVVESGTPDAVETSTPPPVETSTPEENSESSLLDRADYGPDPGQNLTEYANDREPGSAGLNDTERQAVEDMVVGFYEEVRENESERRTFFLEKAEKHCEFDRGFDSRMDRTMLEGGSEETGDAVRRAGFAAEIVGDFNGEAPVDPLGGVGSGVSEVTKYAPLVGSYNQMSEKACGAAEDRTDQAIR